MKIDSKKLSGILSTLQKFTASRATMPVLDHIVFEKGVMWATNLEHWCIVTVPESDLDMCVPARTITDLVSSLSGEVELTPDYDTFTVKVRAGTQKGRIKCIDIGEAARLSGQTPDHWKEFNLKAAQRVAVCAAKDDARPILTGVLLGDNCLAAADGFRLGMIGEFEQGVVVPAKTITMLPQGIDRWADASNSAWFTNGTVTVVVQRIEGNFPSLDQIIPSGGTPVQFKAKEALAALKTVMVTADKSLLIKIGWNEGAVTFTSESESGSGQASFPADGDGFQDFALNGKLLSDALSDCGDVTMYTTSPSAPIKITDGKYTNVIMPMAVRK